MQPPTAFWHQSQPRKSFFQFCIPGLTSVSNFQSWKANGGLKSWSNFQKPEYCTTIFTSIVYKFYTSQLARRDIKQSKNRKLGGTFESRLCHAVPPFELTNWGSQRHVVFFSFDCWVWHLDTAVQFYTRTSATKMKTVTLKWYPASTVDPKGSNAGIELTFHWLQHLPITRYKFCHLSSSCPQSIVSSA
jgi:hypothetical protein